MASTDAGTELTQAHRQRILALRAATLRELAALWPAWSVDDAGTFDAFIAGITSVTMASYQAAATVAADYMAAFRTAEVGSAGSPILAEPLSRDRLLGWLRTEGLGTTVKALQAGRTMEQARTVGLINLSGASGQMVTQGSYGTVIGSVGQDRAALGWARTTASKPCAFCAMLASRGPVYGAQSSASFQAHKACACGAEPVYDRDTEWPGNARQFQQTYQEATSQARVVGDLSRGTTNDLLNAFRRVYERPVG